MIYADLHNHTTASDGDNTPEMLIQRAQILGIPVVGVTDHDTVDGLKSALAAGDRLGVRVVPGVEVSIRFKEPLFTGTLHLLCYFKVALLGDSHFKEKLDKTLEKGRGDDLVRARVQEINRIFGPGGSDPRLARSMGFEDVAGYAPRITRRHFALALAEQYGITDPDEINHIIGNHSPAYLPSGIALSQAAPLIQAFDVVPVLAHPAAGSFPGKGHYKEVLPPMETVRQLFPRFLDIGLKGIEVNYPGHTPAHRAALKKWAAAHHLVITGGSDCHDNVERPLGVAGITKAQFEQFSRLL